MSKIIRFLAFSSLFFISLNAFSAEQKIVYLNLDFIIKNSSPSKLILEELEIKKKRKYSKI